MAGLNQSAMPPLTHVLFDLDGTLTDPKQGIIASYVYALNKLDRADLCATNLDWCIGPPLRDTFAQLLGSEGVPAGPALVETAVGYYREYFGTTGLFENAVYPGIEEMLQALRPDFKLFVATSKSHVYARRILDHFNLSQYFEGVYGSELNGRNSLKREVIGLILEDAKLDPSQAVMIGDREHDILGAKAHGMPAGGVTYGYGSVAELTVAGAAYLFHNPLHISATLASFSNRI